MNTLFIALRALSFATGFIFLWGWVALRVRVLDTDLGSQMPEWTQWLGIIVMTMGGALVLVCIAVFIVQGRGTPAPFDAPRKFVAVGPYRYVRNPMYIGGWILLIGFGLCQNSYSILLFSFMWFLLVHLFVVFLEEPDLERKFGATYEDYCRAVPRWVPKPAGLAFIRATRKSKIG